MKVLVVYATRHGATKGVAEWIAEALGRDGLRVDLRSADEVDRAEDYDAFVIGSAAYMGRWLGPATAFVRRNAPLLADRPVWLYSSGPIGAASVDAKGRDVLEASRPIEFEELGDAVHPRDERVFFGAFDPDAKPTNMLERFGALFTRMPAVREALPAGDFRDRAAVEGWAHMIARELQTDGSVRTDATLPIG